MRRLRGRNGPLSKESFLTMTSAACPMAEMVVDQVRDAIQSAVPPQTPVKVRLVWDPPWTPDKMTGFAKAHFGWPC